MSEAGCAFPNGPIWETNHPPVLPSPEGREQSS